MQYVRPVWRRFVPRFIDNAAAWVRAGGQSVVVYGEDRIDMLLGVDARGKITEASLWSILALEQRRYVRVVDGPAAGLMRVRVAKHALDAVLDWCDRDSFHPGPTRAVELDCLECGACCHEANVVIDESDLDRFRDAGRRDLTTRAHIKRSRDGKVTLRFLKSGRCQQLESDNRCSIYPIRPFNCRVFPAGSEACLAARESTLGLRDDGVTDTRSSPCPPSST